MFSKVDILHIIRCHKICLFFSFLPAFTIGVAKLDTHFFSFFDHSQSRILCIFWVFSKQKITLCKVCSHKSTFYTSLAPIYCKCCCVFHTIKNYRRMNDQKLQVMLKFRKKIFFFLFFDCLMPSLFWYFANL